MEPESQKRKLDETNCDHEPSNEPILCVNNCGFFGSSQSNNLCSKCYREFLLKQAKASVPDDSKQEIVGNSAVLNEAEEGKSESQGAEEGASGSGNSEKPPANRCGFCRKKVGLTGFKCRCGLTFCSMHRYSDKHNCVFDYKAAGQNAIAKANPVVKPDKIEKI